MFATLALAVGLGNVFSPQYMIWLAGLGAVATCATKSEARGSVLLLLLAAGLTQLVYPFLYNGLMELEAGVLLSLLARNVLVVAAGAWTLAVLLKRPTG